jgi:hypothetical protein
MATIGEQFKELFLASDPKNRPIIVWNLKQIFRMYYEKENTNDLCLCGLIDLYDMLDEISDDELRKSNVWNSFIDGGESELLRKVVDSGLDMFMVKGAWD